MTTSFVYSFSECQNTPPSGTNSGIPFAEVWFAICDLQVQIDNLTVGAQGPYPMIFPEEGQVGFGGIVVFSGCKITSDGPFEAGCVMPMDGTISNLVLQSLNVFAAVDGPQSPGTGESYTIVILINETPTSLTCTISGSNSVCDDSINSVTVQKFNRLAYVVTGTNGASDAFTQASLTFTP